LHFPGKSAGHSLHVHDLLEITLLSWSKPVLKYKWAAPWQNQHNGFATSMDPDQPAQSDQDPCCSLSVSLLVIGFVSDSMGPNQTTRMRRLVWIHAGRKPNMLVLSWRGSNINYKLLNNICRTINYEEFEILSIKFSVKLTQQGVYNFRKTTNS
jgi:hypothetical protein